MVMRECQWLSFLRSAILHKNQRLKCRLNKKNIVYKWKIYIFIFFSPSHNTSCDEEWGPDDADTCTTVTGICFISYNLAVKLWLYSGLCMWYALSLYYLIWLYPSFFIWWIGSVTCETQKPEYEDMTSLSSMVVTDLLWLYLDPNRKCVYL